MLNRNICLVIALALLALAPNVSSQETRYISDELRVPLRKGACGTCSIVHRGLVAGTKLSVQKTENGWANVTTSQGLSGWLPEQYLVEKPIARDRLDAAQANTRMLAEENAELKNQVSSLEDTSAALEAENVELRERTGELETELMTIKKVSANALALQDQNQELIRQNRILQSEVDVLTAAKDQLVSNDSQEWFLYGGLTVFLGALLTILLPRMRRRRNYSEWA